MDLYNTIPELKAMVLVPCCLDRKEKAMQKIAKEEKKDPYLIWTEHLFELILTPEGAQKEKLKDENVK